MDRRADFRAVLGVGGPPRPHVERIRDGGSAPYLALSL
jgi:hypothetical protein